MVYNAMKLFMEINPQLFDDCSHEYNEQQNSAPARQAIRDKKWAAITEQANKRKANGTSATTTTSGIDDADSITEDNQKRLDSLKLQDTDRRDRRPHERQSSIGSSRSQR